MGFKLRLQTEIEETLASIYCLKKLEYSDWLDEASPTLKNYRINYVWQALLGTGHGNVIVSSAYLTSYASAFRDKPMHLGVLLVPKRIHTKGRFFSEFVGENPLRSIQLSEPDPIMLLVNQVNFLAPKGDIIPGDGFSPHFTLHAYTRIGQVLIDYSGDFNDPSIPQLWSALKETLQRFRELYDDPKLEKFFERGKSIIW